MSTIEAATAAGDTDDVVLVEVAGGDADATATDFVTCDGGG